MGRTHLAITVELVHGGTGDLWPRPGRIMVAARTATFAQLGAGIDDAFGRWDRAVLHEFALADGTPVRAGGEPGGMLDSCTALLGSRLRLGERFAYAFDLGGRWEHLCTVADKLVAPLDAPGDDRDARPQAARPVAAWGWGTIPDQYGRQWNGDDGSTTAPSAPDGLSDLPPILSGWGPRAPRTATARRPLDGVGSPM